MSENKRGLIFTFDAFFAFLIVIAILPLAFMFLTERTSDTITQKLSLQSEDAVGVMANIRVVDLIKEPAIADLYKIGAITKDDLGKTLLELIADLWASNSSVSNTRAANITEQIFRKILPGNAQWNVNIENEVLYSTSGTFGRSSTVSRRIASGFRKGLPSQGFVASAFLTNIGGKRASSYFFFGGFVGQGNISFNVSDIPFDANMSFVYMEMDAGSNFTLLINGNSCGTFNKTASGLSGDSWTIYPGSCLSAIVGGSNNTFLISFATNDSTKQYVGGGFIRVVYQTKQLVPVSNVTRYYLPGIQGAINYYDSFYIPGNLTSMSVHLEFITRFSLSMLISNVTVYNTTGNTTNRTVDISDSVLRTKLNYSELSKENVLLRIGTVQQTEGNITFASTTDAIVVAGDSNSMGICDIINGSLSVCGIGGNATRLAAAKVAEKIFAGIVINNSGNRVGSLSYHNNINNPDTQDLTSNLTLITQKIDDIHAQGASKRCYACGIAEARRRLIPAGTSVPSGALSPAGPGSPYTNRRAVVMMADGNADFCDNTDTSVGAYNQNCGVATAKQQAINLACQAGNHSAYSPSGRPLVINTVLFGSGATTDNSTLIKIANCTGGTFFVSQNFSELVNIYSGMGGTLSNITYVQQTVNFSSAGESVLYRNSYIDYQYAKEEPQIDYQEIQVDQETNKFDSCNGAFFIPAQMRVVDAKVTSYSSDFWTSLVTVNYTDVVVFNLSKFPNLITDLGDPFRVQIPPGLMLSNKTNNITVRIAANQSGLSSSCSSGNRMIYSARIRASVPFGSLFTTMSGKVVRVYHDIDHDGVQDGYTDITAGGNLQNFNSTVRAVDTLDPQNDAVDNALVRLLDYLNFISGTGVSGSSTNPIDVALSNIEITITGTGIPFGWGPLDIRFVVGF